GTGNVVESTRATNNVMFGTEVTGMSIHTAIGSNINPESAKNQKAAMDATEMVWKKLLADSNPNSYMGAVGASASKPCKAKANFCSLYSDNLCNGVDFTIPSKVVETVSTRSENTVYSYFIGKRVAFLVVEYYVSNNWGKYGLTRIVMNSKGFFFFIFNTSKGLEDVLENGSWKIRNIPVILKKWNMNSIKADDVLKEHISMGIPLINDLGFSKETICIEYERKLPHCETCTIFGHVHDQ
nr:hypothetical protein [Tanacetum cinerariifolium]GFA81180.1 hypothetical protein [Tanacetum cinerariifolium]